MKKITVIPARLDQATFMPLDQPVKRKVAGYARVSTDSDEQKTSYEAQVRYYTNYIKSRDDWEFVNVYTDEGISGTNTKHRSGFFLLRKYNVSLFTQGECHHDRYPDFFHSFKHDRFLLEFEFITIIRLFSVFCKRFPAFGVQCLNHGLLI